MKRPPTKAEQILREAKQRVQNAKDLLRNAEEMVGNARASLMAHEMAYDALEKTLATTRKKRTPKAAGTSKLPLDEQKALTTAQGSAN